MLGGNNVALSEMLSLPSVLGMSICMTYTFLPHSFFILSVALWTIWREVVTDSLLRRTKRWSFFIIIPTSEPTAYRPTEQLASA